MFLALFFYQLAKHNYYKAGIFSAFASLTRVVGVLMIFPMLLAIMPRLKKQKKLILYVFLPMLGLLIYMLYLWRVTGNPLEFFSSQPSFCAGRTTSLISLPQVYFRYFKIFILTPLNFKYFVACLEFIFFNFVLITTIIELVCSYKTKNQILLGMAVFSLLNILLPTLTGTFLSIPRFALMSISSFIFLSRIKNYLLQLPVVVFFIALQVTLFSFFILGYFVA